jgi:3-oxoadipate enol-lactonase
MMYEEKLSQYGKRIGSFYLLDPSPDELRPVLLLHGLGAIGSSWLMQFEPLSKNGFRPMAPDIPGFGESKWEGRTWSILSIVKEIQQKLMELNVQTLDIVGLSMGGAIALQYGLTYPNQVKHLVLTNTFACLRPKKISEIWYLLKRLIIANMRGVGYQSEIVAERVFPKPEQAIFRSEVIRQIQQTDSKIYKEAMRALGTFDVRNRLKTITAPTLVITGENDTTVAIETQRALARGITGARQILIPDCGHGAPVDQPDIYNHILVDFLLDRHD